MARHPLRATAFGDLGKYTGASGDRTVGCYLDRSLPDGGYESCTVELTADGTVKVWANATPPRRLLAELHPFDGAGE